MIAGGERRYVAYYRVSTGQQRESGLGLESQQAQVRDYVTANHGCLVGEYSETVSGRKNDRPQLSLALTRCRIMGAVLRIDCDWHAGATTCLRALFPYVADDGILIADGYPDWDGYARALHEYLAGYPGIARIKQFDGSLYYVVKGPRKWEL